MGALISAALRRLWDYLLSFGAHENESEDRRGRRRIFVGALWYSIPFILLFPLATSFRRDHPWVVIVLAAIAAVNLGVLLALKRWPDRYVGIIQVTFAMNVSASATIAVLQGGLVPSAVNNAWGLVSVLGAIVALGIGWALFWFGIWLVGMAATAILPTWIDPLYPGPVETVDAAISFVGLTVLIFAVMVYFVRQRDRYQRQSDALLRNILPDEIADRLKRDQRMIADHYESASVLFADVVDFTPISASLAPDELVALLDGVFGDFDRFTAEAGLEKIKTVGDEYMVAAGVPVPRLDHAEALCDLALRIRRHTESTTYRGHRLRFRIGIHSGPVVAGIIGREKFSYDLWGDTVNTASRMESHGIPGEIQISPATHDLVRGAFLCELRGPVEVKGKGTTETWLLTGRRPSRTSTRYSDPSGSSTTSNQ